MMYDLYGPTFHSGVVFANRFFVIGNVGDEYYDEIPTIWSSADGLTWQQATLPDPGFYSDLVAAPGGLLAIGELTQGDTPLWLTTNGADWRRLTIDFGSQRVPRAGATGDGFVAFGSSVWTSGDGWNWQEASSSSGLELASLGVLKVVRAGDQLVALAGGPRGAGGEISVWTSTNLVDWTQVDVLAHSREMWESVLAHGPLGWIAAGSTDFEGGVNRVWLSADGVTWNEIASPVGPVSDFFVDDAGFIAVGSVITAEGCAMDESEFQGMTWTSPDGENWSEMPGTDFVSKRVDHLFRNGRTLIGLGLVYDYDADLAAEGTVWTFRLPAIAPSGPGATPAPTPTPDGGGCG